MTSDIKWFFPVYKYLKSWGHVVKISGSPVMDEPGTTVHPDELTEVIDWVIENAQSKRISYDTWQFSSKEDADHFIMLFSLRW